MYNGSKKVKTQNDRNEKKERGEKRRAQIELGKKKRVGE